MVLSVSFGAAGPALDRSPDRARTGLNPGLRRIGTIQPRSVEEISGSNWTLGCETLDRDYADYEQYKGYLVPLGIKTIRLQAGWAKTEKVPGKYNTQTELTRTVKAGSNTINLELESAGKIVQPGKNEE